MQTAAYAAPYAPAVRAAAMMLMPILPSFPAAAVNMTAGALSAVPHRAFAFTR